MSGGYTTVWRDLKNYLGHKDDRMEKIYVSIHIYMAEAIYARNVT